MTALDFKLSANLTWGEATDSSSKPELVAMNRIEAERFKKQMQHSATTLFQPVRDKFGALTCTSGFRGSKLNPAIGGSKRSQHMKGGAFDFVPRHAGLQEVWEWIVYESGIPFGQCLLEGYGANKKPRWIHISTQVGRDPTYCDQVGYGPAHALAFVSHENIAAERAKRGVWPGLGDGESVA